MWTTLLSLLGGSGNGGSNVNSSIINQKRQNWQSMMDALGAETYGSAPKTTINNGSNDLGSIMSLIGSMGGNSEANNNYELPNNQINNPKGNFSASRLDFNRMA